MNEEISIEEFREELEILLDLINDFEININFKIKVNKTLNKTLKSLQIMDCSGFN